MTDAQSAIITTLRQLAKAESGVPLSELMRRDEAQNRVVQLDDLSVDLSRQPLTPASLSALLSLAEASDLQQNINDMMAGKPVNLSEDRPAIHCQLRSPAHRRTDAFKALCAFVDEVRAAGRIKHVVNIGIGGSDLGPAMVYRGLRSYQSGPKVHFVGNIDPTDLNDVLADCVPETTLFVITSKTFTTAETMANAALAKAWLTAAGCRPEDHMVGVTAAPSRAQGWGLDAGRIFAFAEGVGGRYSLWSSVGLAVMLGVGTDPFCQLLDGASSADRHFTEAEFAANIPVLMGLLRVWHKSFLGRSAYGLMPYDQRLGRLPAWAQQLEMESNGKSVDRYGRPLQMGSGPLIWGEPGTNGQHSFFQWLHQGTDIVPVDILIPRQPNGIDQFTETEQPAVAASHKTLAINAVAQAEALALGAANTSEPHRHFAGNRPSVLISWEKTTPFALGRLLALYEHITVVSGFIWQVNSFDQWGVELGKQMARQLGDGGTAEGFSRTAQNFIARLDEAEEGN